MAGPRLDALYRRIGYRFKEPGLLREALTHPSVNTRRDSDRDYERLEFLGDRVLGVIVAARLLEHDPDADAGTLAVRYNALVRKETLAEVAGEIGLGRHLRLARSEDEGGGREKVAILADACEAMIGALYLDGGLPAAEAFVAAQWSDRVAAAGGARKDAKTRLQEWVQQGAGPPPSYRIVRRTGPPHAPQFTVEVSVTGRPPVSGRGSSRRAAEQAAAAAMLERCADDA